MSTVTVTAGIRPLGVARPGPAVRVAGAAGSPALRLTRRGRLVLTGAATLMALVGSLGIAGAGEAGEGRPDGSTVTVTVQPGQTLWGIAGGVSSGLDRAQAVEDLKALNGLTTPYVHAGQRLVVPVR